MTDKRAVRHLAVVLVASKDRMSHQQGQSLVSCLMNRLITRLCPHHPRQPPSSCLQSWLDPKHSHLVSRLNVQDSNPSLANTERSAPAYNRQEQWKEIVSSRIFFIVVFFIFVLFCFCFMRFHRLLSSRQKFAFICFPFSSITNLSKRHQIEVSICLCCEDNRMP